MLERARRWVDSIQDLSAALTWTIGFGVVLAVRNVTAAPTGAHEPNSNRRGFDKKQRGYRMENWK